ncbi:glycoside hydrolase family 2 TIM barrel-domain containing protein [Micromonospora sp. 4G57]|uniref:Glycoside hydrolase family 2 TIM barrel-domain containing protein n=1 Tax=Micromonospora sicca TaxID=2202420 RepID=A0ABU5JCG4_9ACTN|nr:MULTISPECIES: glycoside hydrolase family 2 TIM barrel-domain containing protein [unclassified Micromonospora]MDZ5441660.1 glycoside hydrolase family 2 TIM barrel-domain containing protein [Micromonospora sp. 4G57]MDZ5490221.1 glycoside hydrolase family 2 TIM barrel-domain containing protein [Micromonospora sp. 4G53]
MRIRLPGPITACLSALAVALAMVLVAPAHGAGAAETGIRFTSPSDSLLGGTVDLEVDAPPDTTAVRFYLDDVQLSELTDVYARQTRTTPVWATATDAAWFPTGSHTLKAEADTPSGTLTATKRVVTEAPPAGPGVQHLDGGWQFATAAELPEGALAGTVPPAVRPEYDTGAWPTIVVPDSFGAVRAKWNDDNGVVGVYRRTVDLDAPDPGDRTALAFESCFWTCRYFVNGVDVGSSTGGYLPTRLDVTGAVRPGTNTIAVVIDNRVSTMGEYARPVQGLYWNWGGLLQQVRLERTPAVALTETRAEGTADGQLTLRPTGVNATTSPRQVTALLTVEGPDGSRVLGPQQVHTTVPAGGGAATPIELDVPRPALWDLDHPNLYTVRLRPLGDAAWQELVEQTGFRTVAVHGLDLLLNGKPIQDLPGFNRHADYPGLGRTQPDGLADREIKTLHDKGFRIFRPAHYPTTPAELHAADKYGLLVIEEINNISSQPGTFLGRSEVQEFGKRTLARMVARDRSHPSLFAWSVGNENATETDGAVDYVRDVIGYGRSIDPTRLYTQVSHRHTRDRAYPYQDFFATNYYAGWYSTLESLTSHLDALQKMTGQPILLSEYGAEAVHQRDGVGRGTEFYQASLIDEHNRLLNNRPHLIGKMYWTSTEFWCTPTWGSGQNPEPVPPFHTKGLDTYHRSHKLGWRVMFSPVRIARASVLAAPLDQPGTLRQRVTIVDALGHGGHGTVVVEPPPGFAAQPVPFTVPAGGETTVDVTLTGTLTADHLSSVGFVRAVVDADTEALPAPFTVRSSDTVTSPAGDDFDSGALDAGWQIIRPDGSGWSLQDRPGSLRLSTLAGGETGAGGDGRNLFVRTDTPQADFSATATLDAPQLSADFQQVGLYAYVDDDNYVKADLGWVDGRRALEFLAESGGKIGSRLSIPYGGQSAHLRLVRRGADVAAEYSSDGRDWYPLGTASLGGSPKVAVQAVGGGAAPPVVPTYVDDLTVLTSGHVSVQGLTLPDQPLFTGEAGQVGITVANGTDHPVSVDARLAVPAGWVSGATSQAVPAFAKVTIPVSVTPAQAPQVATLAAAVTATDSPVYGRPEARAVTTPRGDQVRLALDAGTANSPLLPTYRRLSPSDGWDPARGYGWIGTPPQSRDRGGPDSLRRDIVTDRAAATLRLDVPAGSHEVHLLVGDAGFAADPMTVSSEGRTVAHLESPSPTGEFRWLTFPIDGGPNGRTVDLTLAADNAGQYWRFAALAMS